VNEARTAAWYLLASGAVSRTEVVDPAELERAADAINHAPMTASERATAVGWLRQRGAIVVEGADVRLTQIGRDLLTAADARTWDASWAALTRALERLD
jgi:hypothetical protein